MQIKDLCTSCDHWTVTTIKHDDKTATFTCTHCKNSFDMPWDTNTRHMIRSIRYSLKSRTKKYPALKELKYAGDHVKLEEKPEPKRGPGCK